MKTIKTILLVTLLLFSFGSCDKEDTTGKVRGPQKQWYVAKTTFTDAELNELLSSKAWIAGSAHIYNRDWSVRKLKGDSSWAIYYILIDGKYYYETGEPDIEKARASVYRTLENLGEDYVGKYTINNGVLCMVYNGYVLTKTVLAINEDYIFFESDFREAGIFKEFWGRLPK